MATILFIAANPQSTTRLALDEEIRAIQGKLRGSVHQKAIELRSAWAARPDDLLQALNEVRPDVLHFSGHGDRVGRLTFVDEHGQPKPVSERALTAAVRSAGEHLKLVFLNACYSYAQARAVVEAVPCAIGMNSSVGDEAAIVFSSAFYRALGFGRAVGQAFDQAVAALLLAGIPEERTPELLCAPGVDPGALRLIDPALVPAAGRGLELVDMALVDDSRYEMTVQAGVLRIALRGRVAPP